MERIEGKGEKKQHKGEMSIHKKGLCVLLQQLRSCPFIYIKDGRVCVCGKCPPVRTIRVRLCGEKTRRSGIGPAVLTSKGNEKKRRTSLSILKE